MHRVEPGLGAAARGILPSGVAARLVSLDQFRGYTVLGMFVVNFLGAFTATPALLKHHNTYFSYADSIMPQFFFAVGFAYRLTFLRGLASGDRGSLSGKVQDGPLELTVVGRLGSGQVFYGRDTVQVMEKGKAK